MSMEKATWGKYKCLGVLALNKMGLGDILPEGPVRSRIGTGKGDFSQTTIAELEDEFGEEAVHRGLSYIVSLAEANENYKESATAERMKEGYSEAAETLAGEEEQVDENSTKIEEASSKWAEKSKDSGLGIDS